MAKGTPEALSPAKKLTFRAAAALIPVAVLLLLEIALRTAGIGEAARTPFEPVDGREEFVSFSPAFGQRYFNGFEPGTAFNPFVPQKGDSTFRVFALGGSSTAGFPYTFYNGFPARLQERLETYLPDMRVEVINLGMTAVNSYTLWHLKDYLPRYQPDAVVIYAGHNEYYGAFGAGSTIYKLGNYIWLKHFALRLKGSALYTAIEDLLRPSRSDAEVVEAQSRTMMATVVGERRIELGDDVFDAGVRQFEANLSAVLRTFSDHGIPVYVGTLTSNLAGQRPLGDNEEARQLYTEALGRLEVGDTEKALELFLSAKDHDDIRFRAPSAMNEVIRRLAAQPGVTLVDVEEAYRRRSTHGIEGNDEFVDHLHPNFEGYDRIGALYFAALESHPVLATRPRLTSFDRGPAIDPIDQATAAIQILRLKSGFPFRTDVDPKVELRLYGRLLDRYLRSGSYTDSLAVLALNRVKLIYDVLYEGVQIARSRNDTTNALLLYRALLHWQPFNESLNKDAVAYALADPDYDRYTSTITRYLLNRTGAQAYVDALAAIHLRRGALDDAERLLHFSERINAFSHPMLYNMARLHVMRGDTARARRYFIRLQSAAGRSGGEVDP